MTGVWVLEGLGDVCEVVPVRCLVVLVASGEATSSLLLCVV